MHVFLFSWHPQGPEDETHGLVAGSKRTSNYTYLEWSNATRLKVLTYTFLHPSGCPVALEQDIMLGGRTILPDSGLARYHSIQGFPGSTNDLVSHSVLPMAGVCASRQRRQ